MTGRLDIDALRALQAIDALGGVTRAAGALSLSQSAVSHKIKRLEDSVDSALLSRRPGAPLLTEAGERLVQYADRILSLHDEAMATLGTRELTGKIRLGITEDTTTDGLAKILGRFSRLFPDVEVRTHVSQSLILQQEIADGAIDLAVLQIFSDDVRATDVVLFEDEICWVKAPDVAFSDDQTLPFLSFDDDCFYKRWLFERGTSTGHRFNTVLQCASRIGITAAVEAGLGLAILNRRYVTPKMEVVDGRYAELPGISCIVRRAPGAKSNAVKVLGDEIAREIEGSMLTRAA